MMAGRLLALSDALRDHCDSGAVPVAMIRMVSVELADLAAGQAMLEDTLSLVLGDRAAAAMPGPDAAHNLDGIADAFEDAERGPGAMYIETAELKSFVIFFRSLACHIHAALPPATALPIGRNGAVIRLADFKPGKGGVS